MNSFIKVTPALRYFGAIAVNHGAPRHRHKRSFTELKFGLDYTAGDAA